MKSILLNGMKKGEAYSAFAPRLQEMLNSMLEGEMEAHLDQEQRSVGNPRYWRKYAGQEMCLGYLCLGYRKTYI